MLDFIKINEKDNVMVALKEAEGIPAGHKKPLYLSKKVKQLLNMVIQLV